MSAAATAAGYLYASGRLRGRAAREQEQHQPQPEKKPEKPAPQERERVRVAVLPPKEEKPRRTPKIEYRTRRRFTPE
jgi:hypothetical protein